VKTSSVIASLCLLIVAIVGLILLPDKPASPVADKITNSAGLIETPVIQADNAPQSDSYDIPKGDSGLKKQVKVDLSLQKAFLYENGQFVKEYPVSSGRAGMETPTGHYHIINKSPKIFSQIAQCWISYWAGFTLDGLYGFHETPVCDGRREGEDTIGQPASSGCLRLKQGDAEAFYKWISEGASVDIY
jgi:lipoprotein-anchoring transpeptidase ErfK/SrfK